MLLPLANKCYYSTQACMVAVYPVSAQQMVKVANSVLKDGHFPGLGELQWPLIPPPILTDHVTLAKWLGVTECKLSQDGGGILAKTLKQGQC